MVANRAHAGASDSCVAACGVTLEFLMKSGHVYVDDQRRIIEEYRNALRGGEPREGSRFLQWILRNEWIAEKVTRVPISPKPADATDFDELPAPTAALSTIRRTESFSP